MGIRCSSVYYRGHLFIMKLLLVIMAAVSMAEPGYYYPQQLTWPGVYGPGYSAVCYGCRSKRSAEPFYHFNGQPYLDVRGVYPGLTGLPSGFSYTFSNPHNIVRR